MPGRTVAVLSPWCLTFIFVASNFRYRKYLQGTDRGHWEARDKRGAQTRVVELKICAK